MAREDVELVREGYATLERGGVEAFLGFIHPDFERFAQVWWLRDARAIRLETYPDRDAAFAAAGVED